MPRIAADLPFIDALLADETLFERLVAAFPVYVRFAKVLQREDAASRLTLADVANMVGVPPEAVVGVARREGQVPAAEEPFEPARLPEGRPAWADGADREICRIDVRSLLEDGHEPLPTLLDFAESSPADAMLIIDAIFHPQPLRRLFEGRGYETGAEALAPSHWRVYLRRPDAAGRRAA